MAKTLREAAEALVTALGAGREVYIGSKHIQYDAFFQPDGDRVADLREALARPDDGFEKFGRGVFQFIRGHSDWFQNEWSEDVMPIAVEAGLAQRAPYDPEVHGQVDDADPGDEIWVWLKSREAAE